MSKGKPRHNPNKSQNKRANFVSGMKNIYLDMLHVKAVMGM